MFSIARCKILWFVVVCLLVSPWCLAEPGPHIDSGRAHRSREVLIKPRPGVDINDIAGRYRLLPVTQLGRTGVWRVSFGSTPHSEEVLLNLLDRDQDTELLELNFLLQNAEAQQQSVAFVDGQSEPYVDQSSPARYFQQRAYFQISAHVTRPFVTGRNITVAVVDTGIAFTHPALVGRTVPGWDFVDNDADPTDEPGGRASGHGTFIAGLLALIAPDAKVMPLRALDTSGVGDVFTVAQAILYAADHGASIINLSIGVTYPSPAINQAIDYAYNQYNAVLVASAGNGNAFLSDYIFSNSHVFGVAAVNGDDVKANFSNYGIPIVVSAPGVDIYSAHLAGRFATWSGTSFSAAFVSGQAALLRSAIPDLAPDGIAYLVWQFSDLIDDLNPAYRSQLGHGRLNCSIAADLVRSVE